MIINSLLDSDFYKFSMGQLAFHFQPKRSKYAEYSMKCRSGQNLIPYKKEIEAEINHWLDLKFSQNELEYLQNLKINGHLVFKEDYIDFLKQIDLKNNIKVDVVVEKGHLNIRVSGEWKYSIFAEVPMLAIVQEVYWKNVLSPEEYIQAEKEAEIRLKAKIEYLNTTDVRFAEFGTRRRFSYKLQRMAVEAFKEDSTAHLLGTSNVLMAKELGLTPVGSQAHESFQVFQRLATSFETSQKEFLEAWLVEYPHNLKIALTDIFGTDVFLQDFTKELAESYTGTRQDSGVPSEFGHKMKNHYINLGINTKTKTVLFSDDLNFVKANDLEKEFGDIFNTIFGIGTYCSNDTGHKAVSLVMKVVRLNGLPVIKVSDSPGKVMCEDEQCIKDTEAFIARRKLIPIVYPDMKI